MLRALMDKVDNIQEKMDDAGRGMESLRKNQKETLEIKHTVTERKHAFDALISRLDTAEEGISELEDMTKETSKTEKQREKRVKKTTEYPRTVEQLQKV